MRMNKIAYLLLLPLVASSHSTRTSPSIPTAVPWASRPAGDVVSLRPVRWTVVGGSGPRVVASGRTVPITVQADIAKGWHIYSLTQKAGGPIPLRIDLLGAADVLVR